ncbi:MAG: uroporphyrinogen decarboxylase family protein [Candidatus Omnitrophica bacterium]|nr:uroporphyrinogen decarboxylase family protein [Candidatus Omnitrophota bacterium]MCM8828224.1 uroporphyrinogen decarboxylase family protein [Candidatus Omnitrophota bacterium]
MGQAFSCGISESFIARYAGIEMVKLHFDADAIVFAYERAKEIASSIGIEPPVPHLAGFAYPHIASLGCEIVFPQDSEPKPVPLLKSPQDIDKLSEPEDYLAAPLIQKRLETLKKLLDKSPNAIRTIGHLYEGPVTTAMLLMGEPFLTLPYDDPERAHKLLDFCARSAVNYANAIRKKLGFLISLGPVNIPDDFAGLFPPALFEEFVLPYWEILYSGMQATKRHLHSELLRQDHLALLKKVKIDIFDPSADQYVTPEILKKSCPCDFTLLIKEWEIDALSIKELENLYERYTACRPRNISFWLCFPEHEEKIIALLKKARSMA